jgi:hypothetical protein
MKKEVVEMQLKNERAAAARVELRPLRVSDS